MKGLCFLLHEHALFIGELQLSKTFLDNESWECWEHFICRELFKELKKHNVPVLIMTYGDS
jgi:hypothetical protein